MPACSHSWRAQQLAASSTDAEATLTAAHGEHMKSRTAALLLDGAGCPRSLSVDARREPCFAVSNSATTARCRATALNSATACVCTPLAACDDAT